MKVLSAIYGVLLIIGGVLVLSHPFASMTAIGVIVGIFLLIGGINSIIASVKEKRSFWHILMGALTIIASILVLTSYAAGLVALNVLVIIMGIIILLQGIAEIMSGIVLKNAGASGGLFIFAGILYVILAIMLFSNPVSGLFLLEGVVAATLIMAGINSLMGLS